MNLQSLTKFDWRGMGRYFSPKAADELNEFLEKLPQNANKSMLIVAAVIWCVAGGLFIYTTIKIQELAEITVENQEAKSLLPKVPTIKDNPVSANEIKTFVDELQKIYNGIEIKGNSANIIVAAKSTSQFGQFREAIGHIQNGGSGWRVNIDKLCIGKECKPTPLSASLKINRVSVENVTIAE